jgi:hypothetical protein
MPGKSLALANRFFSVLSANGLPLSDEIIVSLLIIVRFPQREMISRKERDRVSGLTLT